MRTADRAPRRRLPAADRRAELLAAAANAFAAAPYADVSVARVAASVGASAALVHHHFGGKRELYLEVLTTAADDLRARLGLATAPAAAAMDGGGDTGGRAVTAPATAGAGGLTHPRHAGVMQELEAGIEVFVGFVDERRAGWAALYRGQGAADPEVRAIVESLRSAVLDALRRGVQAAGYEPGPAVELVLRGYVGFVDEACLAWTELPGGTLPRESLVRAAAAALRGALRAHGEA